MINPELKVSMGGEFKIEATNAETGEKRVLADWFPNLITNGGLDRLGTAGTDNVVRFVQVGSGSTVPAVSDSSLVTRIAGTERNFTVSQTWVGAPNYEGMATYTWQFDQGAAAGNLSEIGVGWATSGSLFSRALILDSNGNPTTITVQSIEFLTVSYRLTLYPPLTDVTGNINISGVDYEYIIRASNVSTNSYWGSASYNGEIGRAGVGGSAAAADTTYAGVCRAYTGTLGLITQLPGGTATLNFSNPSIVVHTYVSGSYKRRNDITMTINQGNLSGGIRSIMFRLGTPSAPQFSSAAAFQCQFTPAIPKDNTKTLTITYDISWARRT